MKTFILYTLISIAAAGRCEKMRTHPDFQNVAGERVKNASYKQLSYTINPNIVTQILRETLKCSRRVRWQNVNIFDGL